MFPKCSQFLEQCGCFSMLLPGGVCAGGFPKPGIRDTGPCFVLVRSRLGWPAQLVEETLWVLYLLHAQSGHCFSQGKAPLQRLGCSWMCGDGTAGPLVCSSCTEHLPSGQFIPNTGTWQGTGCVCSQVPAAFPAPGRTNQLNWDTLGLSRLWISPSEQQAPFSHCCSPPAPCLSFASRG